MSKRPTITQEDWDAWRGNAVTEAVMQHVSELSDRIEKFWSAQLSAQTVHDPFMLTCLQVELKAKREIVESLQALELTDIIEEESKDERADSIGRIAKAAAQAAKGKGH